MGHLSKHLFLEHFVYSIFAFQFRLFGQFLFSLLCKVHMSLTEVRGEYTLQDPEVFIAHILVEVLVPAQFHRNIQLHPFPILHILTLRQILLEEVLNLGV